MIRALGVGEPAKYDVFISYSTNPDYTLVRNLETFLRTFHRLPLLSGRKLDEILVCVDGTIVIADGSDPAKAIETRQYHRDSITRLRFDPAGNWLASADSSRKLVLWDALQFERIIEWSNENTFPRALRFSRDGTRLAVANQGGERVSVFDVSIESWRKRALAMAGEGRQPSVRSSGVP